MHCLCGSGSLNVSHAPRSINKMKKLYRVDKNPNVHEPEKTQNNKTNRLRLNSRSSTPSLKLVIYGNQRTMALNRVNLQPSYGRERTLSNWRNHNRGSTADIERSALVSIPPLNTRKNYVFAIHSTSGTFLVLRRCR